MPRPLRVLIVDDSPADVQLIIAALRSADFEPEWHRVDSEPEFLGRLAGGHDIVLCDYTLPRFSGLRALELLRQRGRDIPFILISGTIGEDVAVAAMKQGAADYIMKDRMGRLGAAVTQALAEQRLRRERHETDETLRVMNRALRSEIDERTHAMEALQATEARFRELAETIQEVFWVTDPFKNAMLYVSPAYEKIWGRTCRSLMDNAGEWLAAVHPADRGRISAAARAKQTAGTYDEEYRIVRPDGSERWIRDRAFPVLAAGAPARVVGVAEDITERKKILEQFLRAQRVEAIGALAGGVAHDLNNILLPMLMAPSLLKASMRTDHERSLLALIEQSAERGASVVRQILAFSRGGGGERVSVQLRHLLKEMTNIIRETFPKDIALEEEAAPDLMPVSGDPTQLHQVLMNLCVNARDAMPGGGKLCLSARNEVLSEADVRNQGPAEPGPHVALRVSDTGQGIPPEIINRIFDPFFTTKPPTKGSGLGLSTVLGIVRSHRGFVQVASEVGRGTLFTIHLPVAEEVTAPPPEGDEGTGPAGRGETVLVVDDEEAIRTSLRLVLERFDYKVETAAGGPEALGVLARCPRTVKVVLVNLILPAMGGIGLARALRASDGDMKIIATSGLDDPQKAEEWLAAGCNAVLAKPCTPRQLLEAVRGQLSVKAGEEGRSR